jgi:hypothetical protein
LSKYSQWDLVSKFLLSEIQWCIGIIILILGLTFIVFLSSITLCMWWWHHFLSYSHACNRNIIIFSSESTPGLEGRNVILVLKRQPEASRSFPLPAPARLPHYPLASGVVMSKTIRSSVPYASFPKAIFSDFSKNCHPLNNIVLQQCSLNSSPICGSDLTFLFFPFPHLHLRRPAPSLSAGPPQAQGLHQFRSTATALFLRWPSHLLPSPPDHPSAGACTVLSAAAHAHLPTTPSPHSPRNKRTHRVGPTVSPAHGWPPRRAPRSPTGELHGCPMSELHEWRTCPARMRDLGPTWRHVVELRPRVVRGRARGAERAAATPTSPRRPRKATGSNGPATSNWRSVAGPYHLPANRRSWPMHTRVTARGASCPPCGLLPCSGGEH